MTVYIETVITSTGRTYTVHTPAGSIDGLTMEEAQILRREMWKKYN